MSFIDDTEGEINFKIVYAGPGLVGKSTNLVWIYELLGKPAGAKPIITLATQTERQMCFDFCPAKTPLIDGLRCRVHLYTVPGPVFYDASRRLILRGVDAVVFVCDSQVERMQANDENLDSLEQMLELNDRTLSTLPHVLQYNKRDLDNIESIAAMRAEFNTYGAEDFGAVATRGEGVEDSLRAVIRALVR